VRQPERLADPAHQRLEDLVRAQRRGDLLKDVEQQIAGAQRLASLLEIAADPQVGLDAGAQLPEVDGTGHRVLRPGLEGFGHGVRAALRDQHHERRPGVALGRRELPHRSPQPGVAAID